MKNNGDSYFLFNRPPHPPAVCEPLLLLLPCGAPPLCGAASCSSELGLWREVKNWVKASVIVEKMRVAIYCHSIAPSIDGVCRRFSAILNELVRQGHEIILFTLEEKPLDIPQELLAVISLDYMFAPAYPDKKIAGLTVRSVSKIWSALRKYRPSVLHITADGFSHTFALIGLLLKIPVVGSFHTDLIDLISTHNANFFQKWCISSKEHLDSYVLDSCATTSQSFAKKLASQYLVCEHIILTSVDTETFNPVKKNDSVRNELTFGNPQALLCVYVGRISREKRLDVIVEAVKNVSGVYLAIIGDGPTAETYTKLHGKQNRIYCKPRFLSHEKLAEIYASSDIHVSASEFETLGNTVLEAFACGIPVIVPRTQGFLDTVSHDENGFLFEPAQSESAQRYIEMCKSRRDLVSAMGAAGLQAVAGRTIQCVVQDLLEWYTVGQIKRLHRGHLRALIVLLSLLWAVPFTMLCLGGYNSVMYLLALIYGDSHKERLKKLSVVKTD